MFEVQDQTAGRVDFSWGLYPVFAHGHLLIVCSPGLPSVFLCSWNTFFGLKGHQIYCIRVPHLGVHLTLIISLEALSPKTVTFMVRAWTYKFWDNIIKWKEKNLKISFSTNCSYVEVNNVSEKPEILLWSPWKDLEEASSNSWKP